MILHNLAIIDLVWFVYLFCRYEARPLNKSTDHTIKKKKKTRNKMDGTGREFSVQHFFFDGKKNKNTKFSRQIDRYTLMKEREM
jgi:hypothetical protein